jgi:CRISPR-associated protein Cas1
MARRVQSGDPDNVEARAARVYWSKLWPAFARRDDEDRRNALLNYGYAVVRAAVARALVAHGLLPAFGLQHRSVANAFNLADDIVESYRPMVDALALERWQQALDKTELDLDDRRGMAAVLNRNVRMGEETVQILTAVEQSAASLVRAFETVTADELLMPRFPDATNAG